MTPHPSEVLTAARMRAVEARAIASGEVSGATLMERAGAGVVAAVLARFPALALAPRRALVLCGPGNNGGDGFVIARLLACRGWRVGVWALGDRAGLPADARSMADLWATLGPTEPLRNLTAAALDEAAPDLILDALFGTGLTRPLTGEAAQALAVVRDWQGVVTPVVAVDLPSGLCADSGRSLGVLLPATLTVTFHRAKCGHHLAEGPGFCGAVEVVDIGLPQDDDPGALKLIGPPPRALLAKGAGHKFNHGHAMMLSGGVGRGGAARLAARAALRSGAGLVTMGCPPAALIENAARLDAVMLRAIRDADVWAEALTDDRISAVCLGPGLGLGPREAALLRATLTARPGHAPATCLDADALTLLAADPDLMALLHPGCILTPHGGEFARLFPDLAEHLAAPATTGPAASKPEAVRAAARRAGCTILLKGADTVIAKANGHCAVHSAHYEQAAPWLATAGSGDVLAGIITGLMARGATPFEAAKAGSWLHAAAARHFGPGLIAEDLPDQLPQVFQTLGL